MRLITAMLLFLGGLGMTTMAHQDEVSVDFTLEKEVYLQGEPIIVLAELRNISSDVQKVLFHESIRKTTIQFIVTDSDGKVSGNFYSKESYLSPEDEGGVTRTMLAGERLSTSTDIANRYQILRPGTYTIQAFFQGAGETDVWKGKVKSGEKKFTIKVPEGEEEKKSLQALYIGYKYEYTEEACEKILAISRTSPYAKYARFFLAESDREWMERGARAYVKKAFDEAIDLYTKSVDEKFTFSDEAQLGIAKCYLIKGDFERAIAEAQKVIDTYPNSNSVKSTKKLLKEIEKKRSPKDIETPHKKE